LADIGDVRAALYTFCAHCNVDFVNGRSGEHPLVNANVIVTYVLAFFKFNIPVCNESLFSTNLDHASDPIT
jgi:hypothetical protein